MVFLERSYAMANPQVFQKQVQVLMDEGFHLRPISIVSKLAAETECSVTISHEDKKADAKSSLDLMALLAPKGAQLVVEASGEGAQEIVEKLVSLFDAKFQDIEQD